MDLTGEVSCIEPYEWMESPQSIEGGYRQAQFPERHVVCVDYGAKRNILRCLGRPGTHRPLNPSRYR
jgi:carbamoyl-phosphate synthase small subunit